MDFILNLLISAFSLANRSNGLLFLSIVRLALFNFFKCKLNIYQIYEFNSYIFVYRYGGTNRIKLENKPEKIEIPMSSANNELQPA